jgi:hypothetical protein
VAFKRPARQASRDHFAKTYAGQASGKKNSVFPVSETWKIMLKIAVAASNARKVAQMPAKAPTAIHTTGLDCPAMVISTFASAISSMALRRVGGAPRQPAQGEPSPKGLRRPASGRSQCAEEGAIDC